MRAKSFALAVRANPSTAVLGFATVYCCDITSVIILTEAVHTDERAHLAKSAARKLATSCDKSKV